MVGNVARPKVILSNSMSIDGKLALTPGVPLLADGRWPAVDGYASVMSAGAGIILEGAGSFVEEDALVPLFEPGDLSETELRQDYLPESAVARASAGWLAVTDSRGRVRWQFKEFDDPAWAGWHLLVLVSNATPLHYLAYLRAEGIPYLVVGDQRVDLTAAVEQFAQRFGTSVVGATGGGRLGGALLREGLIDEIVLEVLPIAVGGCSVARMFTAPDLTPDQLPVSLQLESVEQLPHGHVRLRYLVERA